MICRKCGSCCQTLQLITTEPNKDVKRWIELHTGVKIIKEGKGRMVVKFPIPCSQLEDGLCKIYETRPKVCRDYFCEKVQKSS